VVSEYLSSILFSVWTTRARESASTTREMERERESEVGGGKKAAIDFMLFASVIR
jgi:hypothetical protein